MKIYIKNTETNDTLVLEAISFNDLSLTFRSDPYIQLSESEILAYELEKAKTTKITQVKSARQIFQYSPIAVDGKSYKATLNAKLLFFSKVNGAVAGDYPIDWRLDDDITFVKLTKEQANAIYIAFETQESSAYMQESAYLEQIQACTTLEEVNAINITF